MLFYKSRMLFYKSRMLFYKSRMLFYKSRMLFYKSEAHSMQFTSFRSVPVPPVPRIAVNTSYVSGVSGDERPHSDCYVTAMATSWTTRPSVGHVSDLGPPCCYVLCLISAILCGDNSSIDSIDIKNAGREGWRKPNFNKKNL